jgi:alkylation response protein AidB-like acyl-CoA dehydrogenase
LVRAAQALAPQIRVAVDAIERDRRLPANLVQALAKAGLFRILVPRALGGLEVDPLTMMRVVEELAAADGSVGWCVMIGAQFGALSAFLPPEAAAEIFADPLVIVAGSATPPGRALPVAGGYRVSGRWTLASGCQHCTWLTGVCTVMDGDTPRRAASGGPELRLLWFPAADCEIIDTWFATGLRGTGSHDFAVTNLFVPEARSQPHPRTGPARYPGPVYRLVVFPIISQASHPLGLARSAIGAFVELAASKPVRGTTGVLREQALVQAEVAQAEALLGSARAYLYEQAAEVWELVVAGDEPSSLQRARLRLAMTQAVSNALQAVEMLYRAAGVTAIYARSPLDRCLRDIHTAAAHATVAPRLYEVTGRVLLGLEPGPMFF